MLAGRGFLPPLFGLGSPLLLDLIAIFFLAYAVGLFYFAALRESNAPPCWRSPQPTAPGSSSALSSCCSSGRSLRRSPALLIIGVAIVVDIFAMLQFRAARSAPRITQLRRRESRANLSRPSPLSRPPSFPARGRRAARITCAESMKSSFPL